VHPCVCMRLTHPTERSLHLWHGMLCHRGEHEEPFVRYRRQRTMVIRTVPSAGTGLAIDGAVLQIGRQRTRKMREQRGIFWLS
jgi:hypothetical protein